MNKHKQKNTLTIVLVSFLAAILVVFAGLFLFNKWEVVIDLHEINEVHAQYGLPYEDPAFLNARFFTSLTISEIAPAPKYDVSFNIILLAI